VAAPTAKLAPWRKLPLCARVDGTYGRPSFSAAPAKNLELSSE
jgi:hypothetical protein